VVGRILREYHKRTIRPADIRHVHGSVRGTRVTYRLIQPDGESMVVRALRADAPVFPVTHDDDVAVVDDDDVGA